MTEKEYKKRLNVILKHYEKIEKRYIHEQHDGVMMQSLQHEKNDAIFRLENAYHNIEQEG